MSHGARFGLKQLSTPRSQAYLRDEDRKLDRNADRTMQKKLEYIRAKEQQAEVARQKEVIRQNDALEQQRQAEAADIVTDIRAVKKLKKPELIA